MTRDNRPFWKGVLTGLLMTTAVIGLGALSVGAGNIRDNVVTDFNHSVTEPQISRTAYVHPLASVIGAVEIGDGVMLAPFSSARGDEGTPIHVGDGSNLQDGVVLHALETSSHGKPLPKRLVTVGGRKYAVYIGERVSLAHQSQVHGPAYVGDDTFVGMKALVFNAKVGRDCVLEPASVVIGVSIPNGRYVAAGQVVTDQETANNLPPVTEDYAYRKTNEAVVHVNTSLARGYLGQPDAEQEQKRANHESADAAGEEDLDGGVIILSPDRNTKEATDKTNTKSRSKTDHGKAGKTDQSFFFVEE